MNSKNFDFNSRLKLAFLAVYILVVGVSIGYLACQARVEEEKAKEAYLYFRLTKLESDIRYLNYVVGDSVKTVNTLNSYQDDVTLGFRKDSVK